MRKYLTRGDFFEKNDVIQKSIVTDCMVHGGQRYDYLHTVLSTHDSGMTTTCSRRLYPRIRYTVQVVAGICNIVRIRFSIPVHVIGHDQHTRMQILLYKIVY